MSSAPYPATPAPTGGRVLSIDALRGFDMFWIVGGGGVFMGLVQLFVRPAPDWLIFQMKHVDWEGFSAWDLIMPLFLFIVGAAMPYSFARRIEAGQSKAEMYRKVFVRFVILYVLGIIAQGNLLDFRIGSLRLYSNTLQTIACGYVIASLALLNLRIAWQVGLAAVLLVGYWLLLVLVPVPGSVGQWDPKHNLATYIDELILGRFRGSSPYTWILSSMAFGATVLLGVFSGHLLRSALAPWKKVGWLLGIGAACMGVAWGWSLPELGAWRCPIIKHIFSSSMVLWAGGLSYLLLAVFYLVIDVWKFRRWSFVFVVVGSNAIVAYMLANRFGSDLRHMAKTLVGGVESQLVATQVEPLARIGQAIGDCAPFAILWLFLWYMYRNKTFVRI